ncbi:MAG: AI-2E family transporter [Bacteroidia bacterium]
MNLSFQKLFYVLATAIALFAILSVASSILIPMGFALLISFILLPIAKKLESWKLGRIFSTFITLFGVLLILALLFSLFSSELVDLSAEFEHFKERIFIVFTDVTMYFNSHFPGIVSFEKDELLNRIKNWMTESAGTLLQTTVSNTASFLTGFATTLIYTFLLLIYRDGLVKAMIHFTPVKNRNTVLKMFMSVQQVGQKYFYGVIIIVTIIGFVNSIGLWIIGIESPFLFGFFGAALSIVPYVGTVFGALLPIAYAFVFYDSLLVPIAVAILFWAVQLITDNFLSPRIVGGSLQVNALTAILSLIIGASVWGIAGMILFLPFAAMLKVVCLHYEELKPLALLIGNENYREKPVNVKVFSNWYQKIKRKGLK